MEIGGDSGDRRGWWGSEGMEEIGGDGGAAAEFGFQRQRAGGKARARQG